MSAPSGIKVPPSLSSAFSNALNGGGDVRALVFVIEGGESVLAFSVDKQRDVQDRYMGLDDPLSASNISV